MPDEKGQADAQVEQEVIELPPEEPSSGEEVMPHPLDETATPATTEQTTPAEEAPRGTQYSEEELAASHEQWFQDRFGTTECAPIDEVGSLPPGGAVTVGPFVRVAACVFEAVNASGLVATVLVVE